MGVQNRAVLMDVLDWDFLNRDILNWVNSWVSGNDLCRPFRTRTSTMTCLVQAISFCGSLYGSPNALATSGWVICPW